MTAATASVAAAPAHAAPAGFSRLGRLGLFAALLGGLVAAATIAIGVTTSLHPQLATRCSFGCPPPAGTPVADQRTYANAAHGYEVDYSSHWTLSDRSDDGARFETQAGLFLVQGVAAPATPTELIRDRIESLAASLQDVRDLGPIAGAHVGDAQGDGELFAATIIPASGRAVELRIPVITARRGGLAVLATAIDPFDGSGSSGPSGIPEAGLFDYALTEFRWPTGR